MPEPTDPFIHHPVLRERVIDPLQSPLRRLDLTELDRIMKAQGMPDNWRYSDEKREELRLAALAGREDRDLWIFAYGSLMWNPAVLFAEIRRARIDGYARSFCLYDDRGGRGTKDHPGLMAALDEGDHCHGLVFRIAAGLVEEESRVLFRREMLMGSYIPRIVEAATDFGPVEALTFVANHAAAHIRPEIPRQDRVRYIATGSGRLGTSQEYLENLADHFDALGIEDEEVFGLRDAVRAWRRDHGLAPSPPRAT